MAIDMSLATAPPSKGNRKTSTVGRAKTTLSVSEKRKVALDGVGQVLGFSLVAAKQYADAAAIGAHFDGVSTEVVKLADANEKVAKAVDYLTEVGPYAGLITAALPLVMQLLANHKIVDHKKVPGVSDPEILEMEMQVQIQRAALAQAREAAEARREYEAAMRDWETERDSMHWSPDGSEVNADGQRVHP